MLLQLVNIQIFAEQAVVPPVKGNAMVIDDSSNIYLLIEIAIVATSIDFKPETSSHLK